MMAVFAAVLLFLESLPSEGVRYEKGCHFLEGVDYFGGDLQADGSGSVTQSREQCCLVCLETEECAAWTWERGEQERVQGSRARARVQGPHESKSKSPPVDRKSPRSPPSPNTPPPYTHHTHTPHTPTLSPRIHPHPLLACSPSLSRFSPVLAQGGGEQSDAQHLLRFWVRK
jgi:hypothetical protein